MTDLLRWSYRQLTERLYGRWSPLYEAVAWLVSLGHWNEWRLGALEYTTGGRIVELGAGTGQLLPWLSRRCEMVVAADASPYMALRSANRLLRAGEIGAVVQATAQELPLISECADTIVCTFPAGYILDRRTLVECRRVLDGAENSANPCRLVIAGLWVEADNRLLRQLGIFYGRPNMAFLADYLTMIRDAGYSVAVTEQTHGAFRVGAVIAVPKRKQRKYAIQNRNHRLTT